MTQEIQLPPLPEEKIRSARSFTPQALVMMVEAVQQYASECARSAVEANVLSDDDLADIDDALANLIQDKRDYCLHEEGTDEQISRLEALRKRLSRYGQPAKPSNSGELEPAASAEPAGIVRYDDDGDRYVEFYAGPIAAPAGTELFAAPVAAQADRRERGEPVTDTFVQIVPDKCDRIVWRNNYYHLPIKQPAEPGNHIEDALEMVDPASAQPVVSQSTEREALAAALKALEAISEEMTVGERYTNAGQYLIDALPTARAALAQQPSGQSQRQPDGYAYRYRSTFGDGTVIRFNRGEEVNGSRPIDAVPFWYAPPDCAQDRVDARRWLDKLINLIVTYGDQRHFEVEAADKRDAADRSAQAFENIMTHVRAAKGE